MERPSELLSAPTLVVEGPGGGRLSVRLTARRTVLGRSPDADVCLPDAGRTLSRRHLVVERRGRRVLVRDCSSTGSSLAGEPLGADPRPLLPDQVLLAGPYRVRLAAESDPCPSTRPPARTTPSATATSTDFVGLVGRDPAMVALYTAIERTARYDVPVLILGETGSGKERVAEALHACSPRASHPLVAINCGALDNGTVGSELFGHKRGAFTGADRDRAGLFQRAHRGTVFLDEVGELPPEHQARLLRVLETRRVRPLGGEAEIDVDFRLVAATHRELRQRVAEGRFREDLRYRLEVAVLRVPPLRDRPADVLRLFRHFLQAAEVDLPVTPAAEAALQRHRWPGNVRELRNVALRAALLCDGVVDTPHLGLEVAPGPPPMPMPAASSGPPATLLPARPPADLARGELLAAIGRHRGNRTRAAQDLGISRSTLYARIKRYGLDD